MDPEQNPPTQPPGSHRQYYVIDQAPLGSRDREEAGAAKLWSVYVDEAEKYDKSLVESWRSDMEGMLIFAGLFSASLTAFLVESYKTLVPDSGDATVHLLGQILAASQASNSSFTPSAPAPFRPAVTSLICNALWFVSLGLSLACALMATLLAQWARDFLHRANTRSSPVTRARMYSYLYYGLRRFRMHAVVDVIPSLLHASLGFFFAGLVAFLLPVNKIIAALVAGIMALVVGVYIILTILPLIHFDSPYRTPLSNALWPFAIPLLHRFKCRSTQLPSPSILVNIIRSARNFSEGQKERDIRALKWTVDSLSDHNELEAFVDGIPEAMAESHIYTEYLRNLCDSSELKLPSRILALLRSCDDQLLSPEASRRRQIACFKAMWAIATIPPLRSFVQSQPPEMSVEGLEQIWSSARRLSEGGLHYQISAAVLIRWSGVLWLKVFLDSYADGSQSVHALHRCINPAIHYLNGQTTTTSFHQVQRLIDASLDVTKFRVIAKEICSELAHSIFFLFLTLTASQAALPYRWEETLRLITPTDFGQFVGPEDLLMVETILHWKINTKEPKFRETNARLLPILCRYWQPAEPRPIPEIIWSQLNSCRENISENATFLRRTGLTAHLWRSFPVTLELAEQSSISNILEAIQCTVLFSDAGFLTEAEYDAFVQASIKHQPPLDFGVMLSIKIGFLKELLKRGPWHSATGRKVPSPTLMQKLLPSESVHVLGPTQSYEEFLEQFKPLVFEAQIALLAEFLDHVCTGTDMGSRAADMIQQLPLDHSKHNKVHQTHQLRFAQALCRLSENLDLLAQAVLEASILRIFPAPPTFEVSKSKENNIISWMDHPAAQAAIHNALTVFSATYSVADNSPGAQRVRLILQCLNVCPPST